MSLVFSIIGSAVAIIEIALIVYKYIQETKRQKYIDTIQIMESLLNDTYLLRENYLSSFSGALFDIENIRSNAEIYKMTMNILTRWESFSRGLFYDVYNFRIFIYLTPRELTEILTPLVNFVESERLKKNYNRLFSDFTYLVHDLSNCLEDKMREKKIHSCYKKYRRLN